MDKKFCSDQCRNIFNNRAKNVTVNYLRRITRILKKNRRILEENVGKQATYQSLKAQGLDFFYFTDFKPTANNKRYTYCYEYGYMILEDKRVIIVKKL